MKKLIFTFFFFSSIVVVAQENQKEPVSPSSDFWYVVQNRRSVRYFKPDSIPEKDILKIIDAARLAPTSGNQQPWKFLIIKDKNKINQMKDACIQMALDRFDQSGNQNETKAEFEKEVREKLDTRYFSAPVFIVILTDNNSMYPDYNHWDGPLAAGNLMLSARALGYGTVFITDAIPDMVTKEVLQIPDHYTRVCITPLGIPVEWPSLPDKKDLNEFIVFEKF
ncbi:MAG: nitroreductase family protein [Bacteroidales bacterium]|nr:nitroreductase family protein [Bacteroidales bacterium]